ncbi:MAG: stage IV sporulation protein A [Oscillospiraceae bacterium]
MENSSIYEDIALRTGGDIYIGVVGPVRTGKSTFIKRFMETMVIPKIENVYMKERARDELPQSGSGRTIMTAEPKFIPEEAVDIAVDDKTNLSVRLVDCVGYMVDGAIGDMENGEARKVTTPWFDTEVTMKEAAEAGTKKVITEHSTIGIVITTDGTVTDIPRESYIDAESRVIRELQMLGKPFIVLLNSSNPESAETQSLSREIAEKYSVNCVPINCMTLQEEDILKLMKAILQEFPIYEISMFLPSWFDALPVNNAIKESVCSAVRKGAEHACYVKDIEKYVEDISLCEEITGADIKELNMGTGSASLELKIPRGLFYNTIGEMSGFDVKSDGDLMSLLTELSHMKSEYDKISDALKAVKEKGYGIVMPDPEELTLKEPEIVRHGGKYSVRLKASAPSIHLIGVRTETEVSPAVGGERSSEDVINFLLQEFEGDTSKIWESNIFGKSLHDIAAEGLQTKIKKMPPEAQTKLRDTLQRIINEGAGGLICIIL